MSTRPNSVAPSRSSPSFFTTPLRFSSVRPSTPTPQSSRNARASSLLPSNASLAAFHGHPLLPHDLSVDQQLEQDRRLSSQRLLDTWENIAQKYGDIDPQEDDEVDILTGEIVVNRGKLKAMERVEIGEACGDLFEDLDEEEEDSQDAPDSSQTEELEQDEDHDVLDVWDNADVEQQIETNIPDFLKPELERLDPAVLPKPNARWSREDDADLKEFLKSEEEKRAKRGERPIAEEEIGVKEEKEKKVIRLGSAAPPDRKSISSWNVLPSRLRGTVHLPIDLMPEASSDDDDDDPLSDVSAGSHADLGLRKLHVSNLSPSRSVHFASSRMGSPSPLLKSALVKSGSPVPSSFKTPRSHGPSPLSRSMLPFQRDIAKTPSSPLNPNAARKPRPQPLSAVVRKVLQIDVKPEFIDVDLPVDMQDLLEKQNQVEKRDRSYRPPRNNLKYEEPESPTTADRPKRVRKRRVQYPEPETCNLVLKAEHTGRVMVLPRTKAAEEAIALITPAWKDKEKWRAGARPVPTTPGRLGSPSGSCLPNGSVPSESTASKHVDALVRRDRRRSSSRSPSRTEVLITTTWKTLPETPAQETQAETPQSSINRKDFRSFYLTPMEQPMKPRTAAGNTPVSLKSASRVRKGPGHPFNSCSACVKAGRLTIQVCPGRLMRKSCPFMEKGTDQNMLLELVKKAMEVGTPVSPARHELIRGWKPREERLDPTEYEALKVASKHWKSLSMLQQDSKEETGLPVRSIYDDAALKGETATRLDDAGWLLTEAPSIEILADHDEDMDVLDEYGFSGAVILPPHNVLATQDLLSTKGDISPTEVLLPVKESSQAGNLPLIRATPESSVLSSIPPSIVKNEDVPPGEGGSAFIGGEEDDDDDILLLGSSPRVKTEVDADAAASCLSTSKRKPTATHGQTPPKRVKWNHKTGTPLGWNSPTSFVIGNEVIDVDQWEPVGDDEVDELDEW